MKNTLSIIIKRGEIVDLSCPTCPLLTEGVGMREGKGTYDPQSIFRSLFCQTLSQWHSFVITKVEDTIVSARVFSFIGLLFSYSLRAPFLSSLHTATSEKERYWCCLKKDTGYQKKC